MGGKLADDIGMVLLQAVFALLRRSLGSILKAIFGWATLALFGEVPEDEQNLLTAVVAAAALWPFLAIGTLFPRQAALFLVVLPIPKGVPELVVRVVWIALALLVPVAVGWVIARHRKARPLAQRATDLLRGFPATLGIGIAFLVACVAVPIQKIAALFRGRTEEHLALAIAPDDYLSTVEHLRRGLESSAVILQPAMPPWGTRVTGRILHFFAGAVLGAYVPKDMAYLRSGEADITFYPNGIRISGPKHFASRVHALLAEGATSSPALQCMSPEAQKLEKKLKGLSRRPRADTAMDEEIRAMAEAVAAADLPYDDWQILYRELLQVLTERMGASAVLRRSIAPRSESRGRARNEERAGSARRRLRRGAARARAYGQDRLVSAAAAHGVDTLGAFLQRIVKLFARRR
jgi:hypothetical protein